MVIGIGTDILRIADISELFLNENDPFFISTYAKEEQEQGNKRELPHLYYATRFAGKEAVFKCFGISPERIKMNEIMIIDDDNGQPHVCIKGNLLKIAQERKIDEILISLSYDKEYAIAFATAQSIE